MTTLEIIQLCVIGIAVLAISIYTIVMAIKNKWLQKLTATVKTAIHEAEQKWPDGHGDEKKQYVLNAVKVKCDELGVPYAILFKLINKLVDAIVANHNTVKKGE